MNKIPNTEHFTILTRDAEKYKNMQSVFRDVDELLTEMRYKINRLQVHPHNKEHKDVLNRLEEIEDDIQVVADVLELGTIKRVRGCMDENSPIKKIREKGKESK